MNTPPPPAATKPTPVAAPTVPAADVSPLASPPPPPVVTTAAPPTVSTTLSPTGRGDADGHLPPPSPLLQAMESLTPSDGTAKRNQSKYDFVKVRVWVDDHFYVLSRYLLCRALVGSKINSRDAVQISLDLKRTLVDLGLTDIVQEQFEDFLYKTMQVFGYGESHISCYRMMSTFHRNRVPLLIVMAGTACIGKSTLATKLADRLNLSSVLQTDLIFELMCNFSGREETAYTTVEFPSKDELIDEYKKDCAIVRKGVTSDIDKCLKEGKSLVIEGFHLDPRLYQKEVAAHSAETQGAVSGIVVPFLLTLDEKNHLEFMTNSPDPRYRSTQATTVGFRNLQDVQSYLGEPDTAAFTRIAVNVHSFHETLDLMHDAVLKRIEAVYKTQQ